MRPTADIATALYYTGIDPFTKQEVYVAKGLRDRKMQRALMQFFKPENWFTVREALIQAGRQDLIGNGCDCLIPAQPPKFAIEARRRRANDADHYHTVANPGSCLGSLAAFRAGLASPTGVFQSSTARRPSPGPGKSLTLRWNPCEKWPFRRQDCPDTTGISVSEVKKSFLQRRKGREGRQEKAILSEQRYGAKR
jgi:hypothetical protein